MMEGDIGLDTPLHLAAVRGHTDVRTFLLAKWPQRSRALNINLETPLYLCRESQI
jgi:ankyrin repeat protein